MTKLYSLEKGTLPLSVAVWEVAALVSSPEQQAMVLSLQTWLQEQSRPIARMILHCREMHWTRDEMRQLERELIHSFSPMSRAAEMLQLFSKIVCRLNRLSSRSLPVPATLSSFRTRRSPYCSRPQQPADIARDWRQFRQWRQVKEEWIQSLPKATETTSPVRLEWLLLAAVLEGGILHVDTLVALVRALTTPECSFEWLHNRFSILLSLPLHGQPNGEPRRWFPDPLTAVLLLRLPSSELQDFMADGSSQVHLPDQVLARYLWRRLSAALRKHLLPDEQPRSWEHMFQTVSAVLCTQIPPILVAYARRVF